MRRGTPRRSRGNPQVTYTEQRQISGAIHHETVKSRANLADTWNKIGNHVRAEAEFRSALKDFRGYFGPSHPDTLNTYTNLARDIFDQSTYREADDILVEALPLIKDNLVLSMKPLFKQRITVQSLYKTWRILQTLSMLPRICIGYDYGNLTSSMMTRRRQCAI